VADLALVEAVLPRVPVRAAELLRVAELLAALVRAELVPAQLPILLQVVLVPVVPAQVVVVVRPLVLAHRVVEAAALLRLLSRRWFSAAMARTSP